MFVRPFSFRSGFPVSVSQTTVGVSKPPVATLFPSSLKLAETLTCVLKSPLLGACKEGNSRPVAASQSLPDCRLIAKAVDHCDLNLLRLFRSQWIPIYGRYLFQ